MLQDGMVVYAYNGTSGQGETLAWMQRQLGRYWESGLGLWAVVGKDTGEMVGQCGVTMQGCCGDWVPEIGYLLAYARWHRGDATEVPVACRQHGFGALGFDALYSTVRGTNIPLQKVALRNGMAKVGAIVKHCCEVDMPHWVFRVGRGGAFRGAAVCNP